MTERIRWKGIGLKMSGLNTNNELLLQFFDHEGVSTMEIGKTNQVIESPLWKIFG